MLLGSKNHTEGDIRRWTVSYGRWLANTATIEQAKSTVTSSSTTCTVNNVSVLGDEIIFFLTGGVQGETFTVSIKMVDSFTNEKNDTISFHCVAP